MRWEQRGDNLHGSMGEVYALIPHVFWYVAPARTTYCPGEAKGRPLEFAHTLHNASVGEGLLVSPVVWMDGLEPSTMKRGVAAEAEAFLETVRKNKYPNLPSRLTSYFLNFDQATAEFRQKDTLRGNRIIAQCFMTRSGRIHFADAGIYERLEGRPDDATLAETYWQTFVPATPAEAVRLEVLAESALFFPDWRTFPILDDEVLNNWSLDNPPSSFVK
jgi:hypothetical protein